ncbi:hypothetical protein KA005_72480, partial [bacterium]|nr:hypothetical protein [bacterium]
IFHPYELKKIINGLLLHEDPNILDLSTRLAIANNFLEHLVEEKVFWSFLRCLVSRGFKERRETNEIYFVRKLICLMAFSRYIRPVVCHTFFRDFCLEILKLGIKGDNWQAVPNLVCDLTLALVAIGTKNFMGVDPDFVCRLLSALLEDGNSKKKETAKEIIGAYSASLGVLRRIRKVMLTEVLRKKIAKSFPVTRIEDHDDDLCFELNMGLMNVYEPFIKMDHEFRKRLGILPRSDQDGYLKDLDQEREQQEGKIGSGADMLNYMVEAPGYTCVLKTMLMATNADTVLLFAKNSTKVGDSYFLRDFDTRGLSRPKDSLALHQLQDSSFLKPIQMRMKENLFFFSRKPRDLQDLNNYSMTPHSCMFGTSIRQACAGREQYYVIFGFHQGWESSNTFRTTFYYWLRFEPILREILPLILEKHIVSSTSWNALLQAVRPIHRHGPDSDPKKAMLSRAMNITDLGQYLISAINMTTPRAMSGRDLVDKIRKIKASFIQKLNRADKKYKDSGPLPIDSKKLRKNLIIQIAPLISTYSQFITFHDSILDFILTESLGNAVAACDEKIKLELELKPIKDHASNIKTTNVNVKISNPSCQKESPEGQGIPACRLAANAVGGFFDSKFNDEAEKWEAKLSLPAYQVPTKLTGGWLNAFFNK